ncbi:MAG: O-antigen ligase family protein [Sphingopyxis sp.]
MTSEYRDTVRWPLIGLAAIALTILLHLLPLPYALWSSLPGRELIVESFSQVGMETPAMPLTMSPFAAWNSLFSLLVPAVTLLLAALVSTHNSKRLLLVLLIILGVNGLLAMLQLLGQDHSSFYLYRITNNGDAVGLFANRNHSALFFACGFPLIAAWITHVRGPDHHVRAMKWLAAIAAGLLVPLILVTGSRAGLLLGFVGMLYAYAIYQEPIPSFRARKAGMSPKLLKGLGALAILAIVTLSAFSVRETALDRVSSTSFSEEDRIKLIPTFVEMARDTFPVGAGAGAFVPLYKVYEGDAFLSPRYFNHAHNDIFETLIEYGLPGLIFMLLAVVAWGVVTVRLVKQMLAARSKAQPASVSVSLGLAGSAIALIAMLGSIGDYPLRVPSVAALTAIAIVWMLSAKNVSAANANKPHNSTTIK